MRCIALITARVDSSRLPEKMLLPIRGRRVIEHIIDRAKLITKADAIVLATTDRPQDDVLVEIAKAEGIQHFRGSLEDKLDRWKGAAKMAEADYLLTVDADDLFFAPELCDAAAEQILREGVDFIESPEGLACGAFAYCFSRKALDKVCEIKDSSNTEMMWTYFKDTGLFKCTKLIVHDKAYDAEVRLTLDYPEDLSFFERVFNELNIRKNTVPLLTILKLLREKSEINKINYFRQKDFLDNQQKKTTLKLKH